MQYELAYTGYTKQYSAWFCRFSFLFNKFYLSLWGEPVQTSHLRSVFRRWMWKFDIWRFLGHVFCIQWNGPLRTQTEICLPNLRFEIKHSLLAKTICKWRCISDFDRDDMIGREDIEKTIRGLTREELSQEEIDFIIDRVLTALITTWVLSTMMNWNFRFSKKQI